MVSFLNIKADREHIIFKKVRLLNDIFKPYNRGLMKYATHLLVHFSREKGFILKITSVIYYSDYFLN